nr:PREDICTED: aquaporin-6 isoform X4 [Rhinolophus sinicus]
MEELQMGASEGRYTVRQPEQARNKRLEETQETRGKGSRERPWEQKRWQPRPRDVDTMEPEGHGLAKMTGCRLWTATSKALFVEFLATGLYVFFGVGSTLHWPLALPTVLQITITFNLATAMAVQITWKTSGAHINPAVTLAFLVGSQISLPRAVAYVAAQLTGATVGAAVLYGVTPGDIRETLGINMIYFTGCSMNPARSFGPALIVGKFTLHWIFWVGPLTGAVLASLIYNFILFPDTKTLAQRLAILTGTEETKKLVALEPQKESQSSSEDSIPKSVCQVI